MLLMSLILCSWICLRVFSPQFEVSFSFSIAFCSTIAFEIRLCPRLWSSRWDFIVEKFVNLFETNFLSKYSHFYLSGPYLKPLHSGIKKKAHKVATVAIGPKIYPKRRCKPAFSTRYGMVNVTTNLHDYAVWGKRKIWNLCCTYCVMMPIVKPILVVWSRSNWLGISADTR